MTPEILFGLIRSALMVVSVSLVNRGVVNSDTIEQAAGALSTLILIGFSVRAKLAAAKKLEAVTNPTQET